MTIRSFTRLLLCCGGLAGACDARENARVLTRVAEVRELAREKAAEGIPVQMEGVILLVTPSGSFLHDGESSIWLEEGTSDRGKLWTEPPPVDFGAGSVVLVEGVTVPGGYAPSIRPGAMRFLRRGALPEPGHPSMESLAAGSEDCQWVELEGVVHEAVPSAYSEEILLKLATGGRSCVLAVQRKEGVRREDLVDARVRVRGVFSAQPNLRGQMAGLRLFVSDVSSFTVQVPAPADPFHSPHVALRDLLPFRVNERPGHRKVTRGTVGFVYPRRFFFLQEGSTGIRVDSVAAEVRPGMEVEVAGFVTLEHSLAGLTGAVVRPTGRELAVEAGLVSDVHLLNPPIEVPWVGIAREDWNGRLVRMTGKLVRAETTPGGDEFGLLVASGKSVFTALLPRPLSAPLPEGLVEGAEIALEGTCELELTPELPERKPVVATISSFRLWLSSPAQVRVLSRPSWWTPFRLGAALGGVGLALALAFGWIALLRREVARRGGRLADEISTRRGAELEFRTTLRERERLANDLHDTLEQDLTGLSLQLQAAELFQEGEPERSARHLRMAQQFLDRSREDVHRTVWDLRAHGFDGESLVAALRERAALLEGEGGVEIGVSSDGDGGQLPDFIAGNLFLLAAEGLTNALKHAGATRIGVKIDFSAEGVRQEVMDNGCGFDPALAPGHREGHFGLQGMRERCRRIGATLVIHSQPGMGTTIGITVPASGLRRSSAN